MPQRRFQPPWSIDEEMDARFIVRDHNGQALAYVFSRMNPVGARLICSPAKRRG
jgi:hypothetical protein